MTELTPPNAAAIEAARVTASSNGDTPADDGAAVPEGLELHKDGTITLVLDGGERIELRRPKTGEFRRLMELLNDQQDELMRESARIAELRAELLGLPTDGSEPTEAAKPLTVDDQIELRHATRELNTLIDERRYDWIIAAVDLLRVRGDELPARTVDGERVVDRDELPVWFGEGDAVRAMHEHWRFVPTRRGAR